jgi:hypothetical protein
VTKQDEPKSTYVELAGAIVIGCGIYKKAARRVTQDGPQHRKHQIVR